MTTVKANLTELRNVASGLSTTASSVENRYLLMNSQAGALQVTTEHVSPLPIYIDKLSEESSFLKAKADWLEILNTGQDGVAPSGDVTYELPPGIEEPTTLDNMERRLGESIATLADEYTQDSDKQDDAHLKYLHEQMTKWKNNSHVMDSMYTTLGPEKTLVLIDAVGIAGDFTSQGSEDKRHLAFNVMQDVKDGLFVATNAWPASKAKQFGQELARVAQSGPVGYPQHAYKQIESFSWILYDSGAASDDFILGVAEQVDEIERTSDSGPNWSLDERAEYLSYAIGTQNCPIMFDIPAMAMNSLGSHPRASYDFFDHDESRLEYWSKTHNYSDDDLSGILAALEAGSTDPQNIARDSSQDPPGDLTAKMASYAINDVTQNPSFKSCQDNLAMGKSFEHIISTYMPDVSEAVNDTETRGSQGHVKHYRDSSGNFTRIGADFTKTGLDSAIGVIGSNGEAELNLADSLRVYKQESIAGSTDNSLRSNVQDFSRLDGFFAHSIGSAKIEDAEEAQARRDAWVNLLAMPASEAAGLASSAVPAPLKKPAGWASSYLIESVKDWALKNSQETTDKAVDDVADATNKHRVLLDAEVFLMLAEQGKAGFQQSHADGSPAPLPPMTDPRLVTTDWNGDQRLLTYDEFLSLPPSDQSELLDELQELAESENGYMINGLTREDIDEAFDKGQRSE